MARATQSDVGAKDHADAHFNEALALLTVGDYARGFAAYEWRWKRPRAAVLAPLWLGEYPLGRDDPAARRAGIGRYDQYARYAPLLAQGASRSRSSSAGAEVTPAGWNVTVFARGRCVASLRPALSLAACARVQDTLESVPAAIPYLRADEDRIGKWRPRLEALPGKRVALAWAGNPVHINDRNRSIALARLRPLLATPGVSFVSVQHDLRDSDRAALDENLITHFGDEVADFDDTAALLALADLVITVDTAPAHLAGALGRPLWVLLPFWPDWRWTLDRAASPWYPHARLFRQGAGAAGTRHRTGEGGRSQRLCCKAGKGAPP